MKYVCLPFTSTLHVSMSFRSMPAEDSVWSPTLPWNTSVLSSRTHNLPRVSHRGTARASSKPIAWTTVSQEATVFGARSVTVFLRNYDWFLPLKRRHDNLVLVAVHFAVLKAYNRQLAIALPLQFTLVPHYTDALCVAFRHVVLPCLVPWCCFPSRCLHAYLSNRYAYMGSSWRNAKQRMETHLFGAVVRFKYIKLHALILNLYQ